MATYYRESVKSSHLFQERMSKFSDYSDIVQSLWELKVQLSAKKQSNLAFYRNNFVAFICDFMDN